VVEAAEAGADADRAVRRPTRWPRRFEREGPVRAAVKGAGPLVVAAVLVYLPVAVWGRARAAAALRRRPRRDVRALPDRAPPPQPQRLQPLRRYLYLGALAARVWFPEMRAFYERLVGKAKQAASVAVTYKLLRRLMVRLRDFHERGLLSVQPAAAELAPPAPLHPVPAA
jgi:hypothetical protein